MSICTGFLIEGFSDNEKIISSEDKTWKTCVNKSYHQRKVNWMYKEDIIGGYYASNPTDSVYSNLYPWGWQNINFDDSEWRTAKWLGPAVTIGISKNWLLTPRTTPLQTSIKEMFTKIASAEGIVVPDGFLQGNAPLVIPSNSKVTVLIDQTYETIGYPQLEISGGKYAKISFGYAESLYDKNLKKGNRNDIKDKKFIGIRDIYLPDGSKNRHFESLWLRSFRFIYLEIETNAEALEINKFYNNYTSSPFNVRAKFSSDNTKYNKVWEICERTLHNCTQDNLMSDAYYEQMMYVGDSRVHALTWMYLTGDTLHFRNAIEQFSYSLYSDGILASCYPTNKVIGNPTFSLIWIDMLHDYMMYCTDKDFIRKYLPTIRMILSWYDFHKNENGIPGKTECKYFIDWYEQPVKGGVATASKDGNSATITLHLIYSLQNASELFRANGMKYEADLYARQAKELQKIVLKLFYDKEKGVVMENLEKSLYDQHCNIMAVNTDLLRLVDQQRIIKTILSDTIFSRAGLYYRFNLFNALNKSQTGDEFDKVLQLWYDMIEMGVTTTPEGLVHDRSESHPWSTSPIYAFFHVICGISPSLSGFNSIEIAPQLGKLNYINATFPHRFGNVEIRLEKKGNKLVGVITLPSNLTGNFRWNGKIIKLKSNLNQINCSL